MTNTNTNENDLEVVCQECQGPTINGMTICAHCAGCELTVGEMDPASSFHYSAQLEKEEAEERRRWRDSE